MTVKSYKKHNCNFFQVTYSQEVFQQPLQANTEQHKTTNKNNKNTGQISSANATCNTNKTTSQLKRTQQSNHPAQKSSDRVNKRVLILVCGTKHTPHTSTYQVKQNSETLTHQLSIQHSVKADLNIYICITSNANIHKRIQLRQQTLLLNQPENSQKKILQYHTLL